MKERIKNFHNWLKLHERHLSSGALLSGFIVDALTLRRVDLPLENIIIISYFLLIVIGITVLNVTDARQYKGPFAGNIPYLLPLVIQFAFGGLFSGFTIFYFRSGSVASSWPFILILVSLLVGNEILRRHYARLVFQLVTFFTALFFFTIFFVPVLIARMGPWVFALSGFSTLVVTAIFIYLLFRLVPERVIQSRKPLVYSIASVFVIINVLYFANLIPPIPLSLKSAGVYHGLTRNSYGYVAQEEERTRFAWLRFFEKVNLVKGDPVYIYSAVFAPTNITTDIIHNWRFFDTTLQRWISVNKIPYTIVGGADRGHRGYSMKTNLAEGDWAVDVETTRGQVIGRILFRVKYVSETPGLVEKIL